MSLHYLVDPFLFPHSIIDVTTPDAGETNSTGALLINIPDGVAIHGFPSDLAGLQTAKLDGLLAYYAGFTSIAFDDCLSASEVNLGSSTRIQLSGGLANHCIYAGGTLKTVSVALTSTPEQCVVVWEAYSFMNEDPINGRMVRRYVEGDPNLLVCGIEFDGLASNPATSGSVLNIDLADQGSNVVLTFSNPGSSRLYLGSWAIIY